MVVSLLVSVKVWSYDVWWDSNMCIITTITITAAAAAAAAAITIMITVTIIIII